MTILISACLVGEMCKYNASNNYCKELMDKIEGNTIIPVCPEVLGGLSTPRIPSEIVNGKVINKEGEDVSSFFKLGAKKAFDICEKEGGDIAILMSRSPSCGVGKIYDGTFSGKLISGDGVFAKLLKENNIKVYDYIDFIKNE